MQRSVVEGGVRACGMVRRAYDDGVGTMNLDAKELPHVIVRSCLEVYRVLGPGLPKEAYCECLAREFRMKELVIDQNHAIPIVYKDEPLRSTLTVDFLVENQIIVSVRAVDEILPIHKEAVRAGGFNQYIGNTEIFEDVCSRHTGQDFMGKCMTMLITKSLRVAHATRHVPFHKIVGSLTADKLAETIRLTGSSVAKGS